MERPTREDERAAAISPRFDHLTQLVYLTSGTSAVFGVVASLLFGNAGIALAGISTAGLSLYVLGPSRERAAQTAATLLVSNDAAWERELAVVAAQVQGQVNALASERDTLIGERLSLSQQLSAAQSKLAQKLAVLDSQVSDRQRQIDAQKVEISRLQSDRHSAEQALSTQLKQAQAALKQAQNTLTEKRHELAVHLDAIEVQLLDIWHPLYAGLIAICDRFDPSRPVTMLEFAGKPATLDEPAKRQWQHYRDSLVAYDLGLRERLTRMSEDCESHDEAYGFFLRLLEELTLNYCKLWANIKDLELVTVHEGEKQAIYSEFEHFRSDYVSEASTWVEQSTKVEAGFGYIEESFKNELASLQNRIIAAEQLIEQYEKGLKFPGTDKAQDAANRILEFLERDNIKLDAVWCDRVTPSDPGCYRVWVRERPEPGKRAYLCNKTFEPHNPRLQSVGGVQEPVTIVLDGERQMLTFDLRVDPKPAKRKEPVAPACLRPVADFPEIVEQVFSVPSSRIMGGTGGGKSSVVRLMLAEKLDNDELLLRLHDPLDGSPEDRWQLPKSSTSHDAARDALKVLNRDRSQRLTAHQSTPLSLDVFDEIDNTTKPDKHAKEAVLEFARDARHCGMRAMFIGQYPNVNKAGYEWGEMDNFACLYLNDAGVHPIRNSPRLEAFRTELLEQYKEISKYCTAKNRALEVSLKSPVAHRFALAVIPGLDPFWFELPTFTEGVYNTANILNLSDLSAGYVGRSDRESSQTRSQTTAVTHTDSELGKPTQPETRQNEGTGMLPVCPQCGTASHRAKDKKAHRYYCDNPACEQQTFTAKAC